MLISMKWLEKYIELGSYKDNPKELAAILTNAGLEVENIENQREKYSNVIIGHILEKAPHPDADKLSLCQVSTGNGVVHQIVCGAKNHKANDRVVVALPGAVLPGDFRIKPTKIRGIESNGMLCSAKELGLSSEHEGILILDDEAPIGENFSQYQGLDDVVFELKVTPNRADCLSHYGLAREIAAITDTPLKQIKPQLLETSESTKNKIKVAVKDTERCPRFTGRYIAGVKVQASPAWLKNAVESVGMNSINNVVDITNYVMLELGQPLHAYDVRKIAKETIEVSLAKEEESFTSLDGTELKLNSDTLVIRDGEKVVGLAGVVGGKNSGIQEDTTDLFVECAYFVPSTVRKTARSFGIETDSAYRFSRGVNPEGVKLALDRCCELIQDIAGGSCFKDAYDLYPEPLSSPKIPLVLSYVEQRLGMPVQKSKVVCWLKALGCELSEDGDTLLVSPPTFRHDISIPEDLVEEYARLEGYENLPETMPAQGNFPTKNEFEYDFHNDIRRSLVGDGFQEALNYAFVSSKEQSQYLGNIEKLGAFGFNLSKVPIHIKNPLNEDVDVLRTSLSLGLVKNVAYNSRRALHSGRMFEVGYSFKGGEGAYGQNSHLAFASWGYKNSLWFEHRKMPLVLELKSRVERLLASLKLSKFYWKQEGLSPDFLHPGQFAALYVNDQSIGYIGSLHPSKKTEYKIKEDVALAELSLDALAEQLSGHAKFTTIAKFPAVERDLAFVVDKSVPAYELEKLFYENSQGYLVGTYVFDIYSGDNLEENKKSLAFRLRFQDFESTMSDEQIQNLQDTLIQVAREKIGAEVR